MFAGKARLFRPRATGRCNANLTTQPRIPRTPRTPRPTTSHMCTGHIPQILDEPAIEPLKVTAQPGASSNYLNPVLHRRGLGDGPPAHGATERLGSGAPEEP